MMGGRMVKTGFEKIFTAHFEWILVWILDRFIIFANFGIHLGKKIY